MSFHLHNLLTGAAVGVASEVAVIPTTAGLASNGAVASALGVAFMSIDEGTPVTT